MGMGSRMSMTAHLPRCEIGWHFVVEIEVEIEWIQISESIYPPPKRENISRINRSNDVEFKLFDMVE